MSKHNGYRISSQPGDYQRNYGVKHEPIEELTIDIPEEHSGKAIEVVAIRKGEMVSMEPKGDRMLLEFNIPSRLYNRA